LFGLRQNATRYLIIASVADDNQRFLRQLLITKVTIDWGDWWEYLNWLVRLKSEPPGQPL
jgi:hypothetical protein